MSLNQLPQNTISKKCLNKPVSETRYEEIIIALDEKYEQLDKKFIIKDNDYNKLNDIVYKLDKHATKLMAENGKLSIENENMNKLLNQDPDVQMYAYVGKGVCDEVRKELIKISDDKMNKMSESILSKYNIKI